MLCEHCHAKPASVHVMQVINGERSEQYLCRDCAEKSHVFEKEKSLFQNDFFSRPFGSLLEGGVDDFFRRPFEGLAALAKDAGDFVEVEEPGLLGGQGGYGDFKEKLKGSMKKDQAEKETAETPKAAPAEDSELAKLEKELSVCISREEFERAAEVRDKIRALKNKSDQ